jgi:hypothetical protein
MYPFRKLSVYICSEGQPAMKYKYYVIYERAVKRDLVFRERKLSAEIESVL